MRRRTFLIVCAAAAVLGGLIGTFVLPAKGAEKDPNAVLTFNLYSPDPLVTGQVAERFKTAGEHNTAKVFHPAPWHKVNRENKTDPLKFVIQIYDGPFDAEQTQPMSRRRAEAELKSLYVDADTELLVSDGQGGYKPVHSGAHDQVRHFVLSGPNQ